jgi:hypothetical protein
MQPLMSNAFANKHVPTERTAVQQWAVFYTRYVWRYGSGVEYLHLRVVGGDEKGSLESETVSYIRTITASVQLKKENTSRGSQGACHHDELIGGKPPVVN